MYILSWFILLFILLVASIKNRGSETKMTVSIVIPAYNESKTIEKVIGVINSLNCVNEIIVVDDGSSDDTASIAQKAGATVILHSKNKGKGAAIKTGFENSNGDVVAFIDADLKNLTARQVEKIIEPILDGKADVTKTKFKRKAGRVTELTAKPLLNFFFPELKYDQPLSGQFAAKKSFLSKIKFEEDYGVDIGIVLDADVRGMRIKEVDIGEIEHVHSSIEGLNKMANEVVRTIVDRAMSYGRFSMMDDLGKNIRMAILGLSLITLGLFSIFFVNKIPMDIGLVILVSGLIIAIYYGVLLVKRTANILSKSSGRLPTLKSLLYMHFPILISGLILLTMISTFVGYVSIDDGTISIQPASGNLVLIGPNGLQLESRGPYTVDSALENEYSIFRVPSSAMKTLGLNYGDSIYIFNKKYTTRPTIQGEDNILRMPRDARTYLGVDTRTVILDSNLRNIFNNIYIERSLPVQGNISDLSIIEGAIIKSDYQNGRIVNIYVDNQKVATTSGVLKDGTYSIYINNMKDRTIYVNNNDAKDGTTLYWGNHTIKIEIGGQVNSNFEFATSDRGKFLNIFLSK
ncbi:MAG: glycosyltransferase [Methanobacterium sp.]